MSTVRPSGVAAEVESAAEAVASAQAALDGARESLRQKQDLLLQRASSSRS
jgi:hypothetical protein